MSKKYARPDIAGRAAHRILDWVWVDAVLYVNTPRNPWHAATPRELQLILSMSRRPVAAFAV
jgi:hypothetical protein